MCFGVQYCNYNTTVHTKGNNNEKEKTPSSWSHVGGVLSLWVVFEYTVDTVILKFVSFPKNKEGPQRLLPPPTALQVREKVGSFLFEGF
jgi:hypothetical protein